MTATSNVRNRLRELLAARRTLKRAALALGCAPVLMAMVAGASAHVLLVLALPLVPLVFLLLTVAGMLDAAVRELMRTSETGFDYPKPILCRG